MVTSHESASADVEADAQSAWRGRLERLLVDESFQRRLRRIALRRLAGAPHVEDVIQDVWLQLLRRPPPEARGDTADRAYVESAVSGTAINCRKKWARSADWRWDIESVAGTGIDMRDIAVPEEALKDLAPLIQRLATSKAKTRERRRLLHEVLEILRRHELISDATYEMVRRHRPDLRVRTRTATLTAPRRAIAS